MNSDPNLKIIASIINCSLVTAISLPIYLIAGLETWKASAVVLFFIYNVIFCRRRCLGMIIVGTYYEKPITVHYALLYSISYSSFFYYWQVPGDLLCVNGLVFQLPSLALKQNTFHGWLGGQWTIKGDYHSGFLFSRALLLPFPARKRHSHQHE